jgi:flagellar hook-length control protein FliK
MVSTLAATPAPAPGPSTPARATAARADGVARGRSSTSTDRASSFGEVLDDARKEPVGDPEQAAGESRRGGGADGARKAGRPNGELDAKSATDESKGEKSDESNESNAAPVVVPVLALPPADPTASHKGEPGPHRVDGHKRPDTAGDDNAHPLPAAAGMPVGDQGSVLIPGEVPAPGTNPAGDVEATQASARLAVSAKNSRQDAAVLDVRRRTTAQTPNQHPIDPQVLAQDTSSAPAADVSSAVTVGPQAGASEPASHEGRARVDAMPSGEPSAIAERAAARKRAVDLLGQAAAPAERTTSAEKTTNTAPREDASKPSMSTPSDVRAGLQPATPARQPVSVVDRAADQPNQFSAPGALLASSAESSGRHGESSPGQQHQAPFEDRRLRDALAAGAARGHAAAGQPLAMAAESQVPFARLIDGPEAVNAPALAYSAPLATVDEQIIRGIQLQMRDGGGEARIHLRPEHLGDVIVEMRVERDGVVATLRADTAAARGWIATHQEDLRAGLAEVGLHLEQLTVSDREAPQDQRRDRPQDEAPRRRRQATAGSERFEIDA